MCRSRFSTTEQRFNYYKEIDPDRAQLPFSVTWQGFWRVTVERPETLYLVSPGGTAEMNVGDSVLSVCVPAGERWTGVVMLPPGFHRVTIAWSVPAGGARQFDAGWIVDGRDRPFDDTSIVRRRVGAVAVAADWIVRATSQLLDACIICLASGTGRRGHRRRVSPASGAAFNPHDVLTLAWALGIGDALVAAMPMLDRMITLSGGNDWLTYETHARDIGLNGLWMNGGAALWARRAVFSAAVVPVFPRRVSLDLRRRPVRRVRRAAPVCHGHDRRALADDSTVVRRTGRPGRVGHGNRDRVRKVCAMVRHHAHRDTLRPVGVLGCIPSCASPRRRRAPARSAQVSSAASRRWLARHCCSVGSASFQRSRSPSDGAGGSSACWPSS